MSGVAASGIFINLLEPSKRTQMTWAYWMSGIAALGIFIYLIVALFKPEYFE
jgi:K+-transporting ATPase KdpF subunit